MWLLFVQNAAAAMAVILGKAALNYSAPLFYIGSRMAIGGFIVLAGYYALYRKISIDKKDMFLLVQIMFFQLYISRSFEIYAISQLTIARVCILYTLGPFIAAGFSYWIFNEQMTSKKMVGMIIGLIGIMPMVALSATKESGQGLWSPVGALLLVAVVCNTYGYILIRVLVKKRNYHPILITALAMLGGGVCTLLTSFLVESPLLIEPVNIRSFLMILLLVIVFGNIIAYSLYGFLLRRYTNTFVSFTGFLYPLFGALFGWIFFGERVSYTFFYSIIMVAFGLYVFYHEELSQGYYQ